MKDWKEEKARILALSEEERRKLYTCGDEFVPLSEIPNWSEQIEEELSKMKTAEKDSEPNVVQADDAKNEEKEDSDATASDAETKPADGNTVEDDPEWIKQLKEDLEIDIESKKVDLKLDLSDKIGVFVGDITKLEIDAIVNAANSSLLGGGGVDGAIHRAAGKMLYMENKTLHGCEEGEAKSSGGYYLPAKFVISTVGPQGEYPDILSKCYTSCLTLLSNNSLKSIAFPCISTGVYGYPNTGACNVALRTVRKWLEEEDNHKKIDRIVFCLFLQKDQDIYKKMLPHVFPPSKL